MFWWDQELLLFSDQEDSPPLELALPLRHRPFWALNEPGGKPKLRIIWAEWFLLLEPLISFHLPDQHTKQNL